MAPAVHLEGVSKLYPGGPRAVQALDGVDLAVERGNFCILAGPSGSGKTTLLNLLGGLDLPSTGRVTVEGERIDGMGERALALYRRSRVGFVFQEHNLLQSLSAFENIELPLLLARERGRRRRVQDLLDEVGLGGRGGFLPSSLSAGEQQRVAVARAIAHVPSLLLADEPTASLDTRAGDGVMELLEDVRQRHGVTVILATHDPRIISRKRNVVHLRDGRLVVDGKE